MIHIKRLNEFLNNGNAQQMRDDKWLNHYYHIDEFIMKNPLMHFSDIRIIHYPKWNFMLEDVYNEDVNEWVRRLKENKAISYIKVRKMGVHHSNIYFKYDASKDRERSASISESAGSNFIGEGYVQRMDDAAWLTHYYHLGEFTPEDNSRISVSEVDLPNQNFGMYGVAKNDVASWVQRIKANNAISHVTVKSGGDNYPIIFFKYTAAKDAARNDEISDEAAHEKQLQRDAAVANTSVYTLTRDDIIKMQNYMSWGWSLNRIINTCPKNPERLVGEWLAAVKLGWDAVDQSLALIIKKRGLLTDSEIIAYRNKTIKNRFVNVP